MLEKLMLPVFQQYEVFEVDLTVGQEMHPTRVEIFKELGSDDHYRVRIWQIEMFRISPTFPQDSRTGVPSHAFTDESLMIQREWLLKENHLSFRGTSIEEVRQTILADLRLSEVK